MCPASDDVTLSVHCHDDLGMAVANSLAAVRAGARAKSNVRSTESANALATAALKKVVMAIKTRAEFFGFAHRGRLNPFVPNITLGIEHYRACMYPGTKPSVGENAFAHEAGIHQHGMLQHASTYEIMEPQDVGISRSSLVLGKHSGRHAFRDRVAELGFELDEFETNRAFQEFKKLADLKKDVYDGDIEAIIMNVDSASSGPWTLKRLETRTATDTTAEATVELAGEAVDPISATCEGDGPIAAAMAGLEKITGVSVVLTNFELHSTSMGDDTMAEVTVTVEHDDKSYRGNGTSVDIVEAGARACLEVINRILRRRDLGDADSTASMSSATI